MTVKPLSVQTICAASNTVLPLPFIPSFADSVAQDLSLLQGHCLHHSVVEIIIEGCIAALVVTAIYFSSTLLLGLVVLWCLTMLAVAGFRLSIRLNPEAKIATEILKADEEASNTYTAEIVASLT